MAQAQLGFHWGLQLWLGFFDSRPISSPTQIIQVTTYLCIRAIYQRFLAQNCNHGAHSSPFASPGELSGRFSMDGDPRRGVPGQPRGAPRGAGAGRSHYPRDPGAAAHAPHAAQRRAAGAASRHLKPPNSNWGQYERIRADDPELLKMEDVLQAAILGHQHVSKSAVHHLVSAGVTNAETYHLMGSKEYPLLAEVSIL